MLQSEAIAIVKLLVVGNPSVSHVGHHFLSAAQDMGLTAEILDVNLAYGNGLLQKLYWRIDRLPTHRKTFERKFMETVERQKPNLVLVTGIAPLRRKTLALTKNLGIPVVNFLTDDPWNPVHRSRWFFRAMSAYNCIFSPRRANLSDISKVTGKAIFLPFAYNPKLHFVDNTKSYDCDAVFVGGADSDRLPYIDALVKAGLKVWVYGGYWNKFGPSGVHVQGHADVTGIRQITSAAKTNLILVRRANRDGHVMRSFEAAACGGCLVVEETEEHSGFFGNEAVVYFQSPSDLVAKTREVINDHPRRRQIVEIMRERIVVSEAHTYSVRLKTIFETIS